MFSKIYKAVKRKEPDDYSSEAPQCVKRVLDQPTGLDVVVRNLFELTDDIALLRSLTATCRKMRWCEEVLFANKFGLSLDQAGALLSVLGGYNTFLSGSAGTGKTHLIKLIDRLLEPYRRVQLTTTTGITAVELGCKTLHSFSGIGIRKWPIERPLLQSIATEPNIQLNWRNVDVLIIDEISMLSPEQFELCARIQRFVRHTYRFFAGLQIIAVGDFLQLPPIDGKFLYTSSLWQELKFRNHFLNTPWRQTDRRLFDILQEARFGKLSFLSSTMLRSRVRKCADSERAVYAFSRRIDAKKMNDKKFAAIEGEARLYKAMDTRYTARNNNRGKRLTLREKDSLRLERTVLVSHSLLLKTGCRVMAVKNDDQGLFANGSTGVVLELYRRSVLVLFDHSEYPVNISALDFEVWDNDEVYVRTQIPLILAYAITIHKTQGMTIEHLHGNLGTGAMFAPGQAYVFLSRCRSLDGLCLKAFDARGVFADEATIEYYNKLFDNNTSE
jgi:hypothetical protein